MHRCFSAAEVLPKAGISSEMIDLRLVAPLDVKTIVQSVQKTKKLVVVDEDYTQFGLSCEIAVKKIFF